jgi:hypothetical protein
MGYIEKLNPSVLEVPHGLNNIVGVQGHMLNPRASVPMQKFLHLGIGGGGLVNRQSSPTVGMGQNLAA